MAIVVVGGSGRGVGKTALACGLIAALPEFAWTAVKITNHNHGHPTPLWEETAAGHGTDTARYLAAGAARSLLAAAPPVDRSPHFDFPQLLRQIRARLQPRDNILFESNRVLEYLKPDLCLVVDRLAGQAPFKPSFSLAARCADASVVWAEADRMLQPEPEAKPVFHLAKLERLSPQMLAWLRSKLDPKPHPGAE